MPSPLHVQSFEAIVRDPVGAYEIMQNRLAEQGPNAPFPEFKPAVDYVNAHLRSEQADKVLTAHPDLGFERKEAATLLAHVNVDFVFDDEEAYPYERPFAGPYPYRPTLDAIESGLRALDKISRLNPNSKAVPLYHFDRYAYHRHSLMADPQVVLFPTPEEISYEDFIRTRAVPIGFIGVTGDVLRVDRHQQSPLDFWYHDMNHVRRMVGYSKRSEKQHGADTPETKASHYRKMDQFVQDKLMPMVVELPQDASEAAQAVRKLKRVILFEILHETALTPEPENITSDLLRGAVPQPFEHMVTNKDSANIENLRTPTGNLQSGVSTINQADDSPITVRFFDDRALALLANVYNKLNFGFYDDPNAPSDQVTPTQYRTSAHILQAVHEIFEDLGYTDVPNDEHLLALIESREGSEEKFVYQGVSGSEAEKLPYATEPLSAQKIIEEIHDLGKKVVTLFGFSYLGYENPDQVLGQIEDRLQTLDPKTTVINIGATEEGIGAAYATAKKLGFITIGVVSTLALSYSGRFSDDVDRIYIVNDERWGGYVPGTDKLADTTQVYLAVSDAIHAFGGGDNTAATLTEADQRGLPITYTPAEMDHQIADKDTTASKVEVSTRYQGSAFRAWQQIQSSKVVSGLF